MAEGPRRLDGYLSELRARLRNLPDAEASEILEELRSHVCDSVGTGGELTESGVAAALRRLGSPAEAGVALRDGQPARAGRAQPVPMGLLLGAGAFWLTPRFGRWAIRRFRRTPLVPTR